MIAFEMSRQLPVTRDPEKLKKRVAHYGEFVGEGKGYLHSGYRAPKCVGTNRLGKPCKKHTIMYCQACADHAVNVEKHAAPKVAKKAESNIIEKVESENPFISARALHYQRTKLPDQDLDASMAAIHSMRAAEAKVRKKPRTLDETIRRAYKNPKTRGIATAAKTDLDHRARYNKYAKAKQEERLRSIF